MGFEQLSYYPLPIILIMKQHLLAFIISIVAFVIATFFLPGLNYGGSSDTLVRAAIVFGLLNTFLRPVLKIILLPLNFLTLGLLGGLTGLILLWLVSVLVPGFTITTSHFAGLNLAGLNLPAYELNQVLTIIFGATLIGVVSSTLYWVAR